MATVKLTPIKDLKLAKYNPESRCSDIGPLTRSIEEVGLLYPVLIDTRGNVIDGHRRIAAHRKLGLTEIPTLAVDGEQATLFAHVNGQTKRLTGNETLRVYLAEPKAINTWMRTRFELAEEMVGRPMLERMAREGLSYATYRVAAVIAKSADQNSGAAIKQLVKWMMHFGNTSLAQKAVRSGMSPGMIITASERMKQIRPRFDISK